MAKYECKVCGYIYNEQHASRSFDELTECPICNEGKENFISLDPVDVTVEPKTENVQVSEDEMPVATAENPQVKTEAVEELVSEKQENAFFVKNDMQASANFVSMYKEIKNEEVNVVSNGEPIDSVNDVPEFVVERRQEFWTPLSAKTEKKEESSNTTGWTISNARGSVETVLGQTSEEDKAEEAETEDVEEENVPAYASRIESFYSSSEPVGTSHIISGDEDEEPFKPLWNSGGGTVQRVIDPFGDRNESVVKAENVGMVMPAEEPVVEEILGEETEEITDVAESVTEDSADVKEEVFFFEDEKEDVLTAKEAVEEVAEENVEEMVEAGETIAEEPVEAMAEEAADVFAAEEPEEMIEEVAEETVEEMVSEEPFTLEETVETIVEETAETVEPMASEANEEFLDDEEDDFFTEMTIDAMVEPDAHEEHVHEHGDSGISEEDVFRAIDAIEFDDEVPEGGRIEVVTGDDNEDDFTFETVFEDEPISEAEEVNVFTDEEMPVEEISEEPIEETVVESVEETLDEPEEEAFLFEELDEIPEDDNRDDFVEEVAEEAEATTEETASGEEAPRIKAWSFLDDVVEAGAGVAGVTFVAKAMDEVIEDDVTEEDIEEVFVDFEAEATVEVQPQEEPQEDPAYCNHLEQILIVPAQLNPMPLPEGTQVQGRTVLGIASERPLVLDNPVFSTGDYNMVQYIPNSGLTSEDYQKADAIEVIVGHGNGIEKTINSKEDLRQVVNFLRLESDGCPIGIKMGAARIERDLEFCVFAKPDYVVLNNFSVIPLPYALHRAIKYLNTVQSDMDIVIALDGAKDAEELAKIMAMGADVIALRNRPAKMDEMMEELKNYARITGHYDVEDLNVKDLCTIDREIAAFTDIYHV